MPYNDSLPGPGVYSIKAYAVLSNGSYVDSLYTGFTELKNEGRLNVYSNTAVFPLCCIFCNECCLAIIRNTNKSNHVTTSWYDAFYDTACDVTLSCNIARNNRVDRPTCILWLY